MTYGTQSKDMTKKLDKIIGIALLILSALCILRALSLCTSTDIWYDELFTMEFANKPVTEMISLTARDVHPPLYYFLVKFGLALGKLYAPLVNGVVIAKIVSVVPFILILILACTKVRKSFGYLAAGVFSFCTMAMPQMTDYMVEIRMYGWALFFVTAALLHAYALLEDKPFGEKSWRLSDAIPLALYSIAACYTHYYACIAVFCIYFLMFIWMIVFFLKTGSDRNPFYLERKLNFRVFGVLLIDANLTAFSFLPWVSALAGQVGDVKSSYWIQPLTIRSIGGCIKFLFKPSFSNQILANAFAVVLFAGAAFVCIYTVLKCSDKLKAGFIIISLGTLVMLVAAGFILSALIRPVFVYRYMLPACGGLWLAVGVSVQECWKRVQADKSKLFVKLLSAFFTLVILICGIRGVWAFRGNELYKEVQMENTKTQLLKISPDTKIVCNFMQVQGVTLYELENCLGIDGSKYEIYLYEAEPETLIAEMMPQVVALADASQIREWLDNGENVIFLGSFNARDEILAQWKENYGIDSTDTGSCMLERYWFDIYELEIS